MAAEENLMSEGNALVGMYVGMHLDAAFLLSGLGMHSHALVAEVREERDGSGIYDLKPGEPLGSLPLAAVEDSSSLYVAYKPL